MKFFFLFVLFAFVTYNSQAQSAPNNTCANFQKGKFFYLDSLRNRVMVKRKNKKQIEYNEKTTVKTIYKVKWINACEYELRQIWTDSKSHRKFNGGISTVIISKVIDQNSYEYTCGCKDEKLRVVQGIMKRVS